MGRMREVWSFVKTLRVEPYIFIHMFAGSIAGVTTGLLQQDKICVNTYGQSNQFCTDLNAVQPSEDPDDYKDKVLAFATQMGLYSTLLDTIPSVIWSLFIGSFTDKFIHGRKIVMCLSSIGGIMGPYYLLLTSIPPILCGGGIGSLMAVYSYVSVNTKESLRSIRYAIIEFSFFLGSPLGTYVGGLILKDTPDSSGGQLHNYITIIGISLVMQIIAFILLFILINEKKSDQSIDGQTLVTNEVLDTNSNEIMDSSYKRLESTQTEDSETPRKWYYPITLLFDIDNVKEVWICCVKRRPNFARLQIWLLFMSMCLMVMTFVGSGKVQFPFSEKVYLWSATFYSNVHSISSIVNSVLMTISVPLFVVRLKLADIHLALIGFTSQIFRNIIVGSYQHPMGYYISVVIGSIGGLVSIAIRSKLSKLVQKEELGKVFSLLATLESVTPLIASLIFTFIFEWSLNFFPGLLYEVCAAFMVIPLLAMIYIDLKIDTKDMKSDNREDILP